MICCGETLGEKLKLQFMQGIVHSARTAKSSINAVIIPCPLTTLSWLKIVYLHLQNSRAALRSEAQNRTADKSFRSSHIVKGLRAHCDHGEHRSLRIARDLLYLA